MMISHMLIETAYGNGDLDADIYMEITNMLRKMLQRMAELEGTLTFREGHITLIRGSPNSNARLIPSK